MYQFLKFRVLPLLRFMKHRAHPRDRIDASFPQLCLVFHNSKSFMVLFLATIVTFLREMSGCKPLRAKECTASGSFPLEGAALRSPW